MIEIIFTFTPLIIFVFLSYFLFSPIQKVIDNKLLSFFTSLLVSPLFISLFYHLLIYIFPNHQDIFYILALVTFTFLISIISLKFFGKPTLQIPKGLSLPSSPTNKLLILINLIIISTTIVRTVFWPINWDDQILYLRQSYVYHQTQSAHTLYQLIPYKDNQIEYQMNASIRPALPIIFSLGFFFSNSIRTVQYYCQFMIVWFFISLLGITYSIAKSIFSPNRTIPQLTLFLILTCYYLINFTIYGFKEPSLMALTLLSLYLIYYFNSIKTLSIIQPVILGITTGLVCFINYSGSVLSSIIIIIYFLYVHKNLLIKIKYVSVLIISLMLFSFCEPIIFLSWVVAGIIPKSDTQIINESNLPPQSNYQEISRETHYFISQMTTAIIDGQKSKNTESSGYKILQDSNFDYLIKGKLQGLFQIQFYGPVIIFFLIVLLINFKSVVSISFNRLLLIFLLLYCTIFFDPFNLNPNRYSYVLNISPKYTIMLIPILAIIISSQFKNLCHGLNKIPKNISLLLFFLIGLMSMMVIFNGQFFLLHVSNIIPLYRDNQYYLDNILSIGYMLLVFSVFSIIYILFFKSKHNFILIIILPFTIIFSFFYNLNFGFLNTYKYALSGLDIKLENIKSDQDYFKNLNFLNWQISNEGPSIKTYTCKINGNGVFMYANYISIDQLAINQCQISDPIKDKGLYFSQMDGLEISPELSAKVRTLFLQGNYGIYQLTD